jgi:transcriptional regulator with XRE-family HTH domain
VLALGDFLNLVAAQEDFYIQLGLLIRKARVKAGLTQQELADTLLISRTSLTNIEKGNQRLLVHVLIDIADSLGIKPILLLPSSSARTRPGASSQIPTGRAKKESDFLASVLNRANKRKK